MQVALKASPGQYSPSICPMRKATLGTIPKMVLVDARLHQGKSQRYCGSGIDFSLTCGRFIRIATEPLALTTWSRCAHYLDIQTEALIDVIIGYQISNKFKFPIAAFHHAHEAYLVPNILKSAYGKQRTHLF